MPQPVFVIGDVHGHFDRLEALLRQEGLLIDCDMCYGLGHWVYDAERDHSLPAWVDKSKVNRNQECPFCHGDGVRRVRNDVLVIQIGDLGHFGQENRTGDILCYKAAYEGWIDVVLWGNHDRFVVDETHAFTGCMRPGPETKHYINALHQQGRYQLAIEAHGFLLTHAGLHTQFRYQRVPNKLKEDLIAFVDWSNDEDEKYLEEDECDKQLWGIRDAISRKRMGASRYGGILWRDISESLYPQWRQIFGHSADPQHQVRYCHGGINTRHPEAFRDYKPNEWSYCIDIGGKGDFPGDACLAGIWLPEERIARVDL